MIDIIIYSSSANGVNKCGLHFCKQAKKDSSMAEGSIKSLENELTCTIYLDQVNHGKLVCSLPCLHQFHVNCVNPWLRQQGTCPVCKFQLGSGRQESRESESDGSDMI